jgi:hypothetical protein
LLFKELTFLTQFSIQSSSVLVSAAAGITGEAAGITGEAAGITGEAAVDSLYKSTKLSTLSDG